VPITGQTFVVLLTGALLGSWRSFGAMLIYLAEGLAGLPVFAPGALAHAGLGPFLGPTGGYLVAFPLAALVVGFLAERVWGRRPARLGWRRDARAPRAPCMHLHTVPVARVTRD